MTLPMLICVSRKISGICGASSSLVYLLMELAKFSLSTRAFIAATPGLRASLEHQLRLSRLANASEQQFAVAAWRAGGLPEFNRILHSKQFIEPLPYGRVVDLLGSSSLFTSEMEEATKEEDRQAKLNGMPPKWIDAARVFNHIKEIGGSADIPVKRMCKELGMKKARLVGALANLKGCGIADAAPGSDHYEIVEGKDMTAFPVESNEKSPPDYSIQKFPERRKVRGGTYHFTLLTAEGLPVVLPPGTRLHLRPVTSILK